MVHRPPVASPIAARMPSGESPPRKPSAARPDEPGDLRAPGVAVSRGAIAIEQCARLAFASPTSPTATGTFFPISEASRSMWMILAPRANAGEVAGHPVVEAESYADDDVGLLDGAIDVHLAVHARHAQMEGMRLGEGADPEEGGDHRDAGALGEARAAPPRRRRG